MCFDHIHPSLYSFMFSLATHVFVLKKKKNTKLSPVCATHNSSLCGFCWSLVNLPGESLE